MRQEDTSNVAKLDFVREAMRSLAACAVDVDNTMLRRWFPRAFNHWYCPAVRTGYRGTMAPVFDLGLRLCQPMAAIRRSLAGGDEKSQSGAYVAFLEKLRLSPLMERAQGIWEEVPDETRLADETEPSGGTRPAVERILVRSMLLALDGVWDEQHTGPAAGLPWLESAENGQAVDVCGYLNGPSLGRLPLSLDAGKGFPVTYPSLIEERVRRVPDPLDLFVAYVAAQTPHAEERLDYQVVEACLGGPNLSAQRYDPPPLHRTEEVKHTRSTLPGTNAGVTRAEVKLPEDPPISILPSELALVKAWEDRELRSDPSACTPEQRRARALFPLADILLNRKPLVYKRENPRDLVPRHRALVCFVTGAGPEGPVEFTGPSVHPYSYTYVWAKRQTFDLIRDLRAALEETRLHACVNIDIDIAVFGVRQNEGITVVHSRFPLQEMPVRQNAEKIEDRIKDAMAFDDLVPGFFDLLPEKGRRDQRRPERLTPGQLINPHVGAFLRHEAQSARPYHAVHLVLAGSEFDHWTFIRIVGRYSGLEMRSRQFLTLIGADLSGANTGGQTPIPGEPTWLYLRVRTTTEACASLGRGQLPRVSLEMLRRRFVESVMGRAKQRDSSLAYQMRLA
jgi:hypothetical protein